MNAFNNKKLQEDLWGIICEEYYNTGQAEFIIRRDDGYEDVCTVDRYFRNEPSEFEKRALKNAQGHILDVGCGPGAIILYLQNHGKVVTGIDNSHKVVKIARERGARDVREMSFWDINKLDILFDSVILIGNNMGLSGNLEKTEEMLKLFHEQTNDNAVLIGHSIDPTLTANKRHLLYHEKNEKEGKYLGQLKIRKEYKDYASSWWDLILFEEDVLISLCEDNGWRKREIISNKGSYFIIADKK